jgi:hypothetical protein
MKQIKRDGKKTGHARKYSDKIWAEFKACNQYFDKLKEQKAEDNAEEMEAFEKLLSNAELSAGR